MSQIACLSRFRVRVPVPHVSRALSLIDLRRVGVAQSQSSRTQILILTHPHLATCLLLVRRQGHLHPHLLHAC